VTGVVSDVTERRIAEFELAAEKERLAVTLRAMEEAVITLNTDSCVQFMNRAAESIFNVSSSSVYGRDLWSFMRLVDVETRGPLAFSMEGAYKEGIVVDLPVNCAVVSPSGELLDLEGQERYWWFVMSRNGDAWRSIFNALRSWSPWVFWLEELHTISITSSRRSWVTWVWL
jgi:PAS domain-containing protein